MLVIDLDVPFSEDSAMDGTMRLAASHSITEELTSPSESSRVKPKGLLLKKMSSEATEYVSPMGKICEPNTPPPSMPELKAWVSPIQSSAVAATSAVEPFNPAIERSLNSGLLLEAEDSKPSELFLKGPELLQSRSGPEHQVSSPGRRIIIRSMPVVPCESESDLIVSSIEPVTLV